MFKFLSSLILIILSANSLLNISHTDDKISSALKKDYPGIHINITDDYTYLPQTTPTPTAFFESSLSNNGKTGDHQSDKSTPQIKVEAYNTRSDKPIEVAQAAVIHSNAIIACSQANSGCDPAPSSPTPTPVPTQSPKPTPSQVPEPTIVPLPTPFCKYTSEMPCRMIECPDLGTGDFQNICGCPCVPPPVY